MNKVFMIILLVCIYALHANSQSRNFELFLSDTNDKSILDAMENEFGDYYCVGFTRSPNSNHFAGLLLKINTYGQIVDSVVYSLSEKSFQIHRIIQDTIGTFILIGYLSDTTQYLYHSELSVKRVNYQLEELNEKNYFISESRSIGLLSSAIGINNDILITSGLWSNTPPPVKLLNIRLSCSFDSITSTITQSASSGLSIKQLTDSTYWILLNQYYYLLTDTLFNNIQYSKMPLDLSDPIGVKWDSDTSFYLCGEWNHIDDNDIGIIKQFHPLDTIGFINNKWGTADTLDLPAGRGGALDFRNKDSIYIGGTTNFQPGWPNFPSYFFLIQTDSMLNVRWERFYGGDMFYEMNDVLATNDGGCLMSGLRYDYASGINKHDIYIIKVNSEGILVGTEHEIHLQSYETIVYPNPGNEIINVRIAAQYKQSVFELFDMKGRQILKKEITGTHGIVNTTFLKHGTYIYNITSNDGLFESGRWIKQ